MKYVDPGKGTQGQSICSGEDRVCHKNRKKDHIKENFYSIGSGSSNTEEGASNDCELRKGFINRESIGKELDFDKQEAAGNRLDKFEGALELEGGNDAAEIFEKHMFVEEKLHDTLQNYVDFWMKTRALD